MITARVLHNRQTHFFQRKVLALYFHNATDGFSNTFCQYLKEQQVLKLIEEHFYFLGWDIGNDLHNDLMKSMLEAYSEMDLLKERLVTKRSGLFLIIAVRDMINIFTVLHGSLKLSTLIEKLTTTHKYFMDEMNVEDELDKSNDGEEIIKY